MNFEIEERDCNSRIGWIEYKGKKIEIPGILWYSSNRIPSPNFAKIKLGIDIKSGGTFFYPKKGDLPPIISYPYFFPQGFHDFIGEWNERNANDFEIISAKSDVTKKEKIYVIQNSIEIYSNPRNFVNAIISIRKKIGYKPLYAPAIALPYNLSILIYAGIDIVDSISLILKTRKGIYFTAEGEYNINELEEYPCSCQYCKNGIKNFEELLMHNYEVMKNELIKIKNAIKKRNLRTLVESKAAMHPNIASILRLLDIQYEYQEKRFPINGNKINVSCLSFNMPSIRRFRERILKRYVKPESAKILLLLPCSAKKPYSKSKSHMLFRKVINKISNRNIIHEVILTSPLGIVPREIENFYPAAHYNISVIGKWDKEEKQMLQNMLDEFLKKNKYDIIISHLPKEMDFLDIDAISTCKEKPTYEEDLKRLEEELKITEDYGYVYPGRRRRDNVKSMLLFQFGNTAENFLDGCSIRGKFPDYKIYCDDKQVAIYVARRGMFSLTLPGGKRLGKNYWLEIDDFIPKGCVFAAGVKNADEKIRNGDEVVVFHENELRAVGVAKMNGEEMVESEHGEAVKIRHHI